MRFARPSSSSPRRRPAALAGLGALVWVAGCGGGDDPDEVARLERVSQPIAAICTAQVDGTGEVDVETDYLPHVVACENGGADFAALQAQAVAARTYLYYKIGRQGHIGDGQGDQVYSCGRGPGQSHIDAAASTAGQVLRYHGDVIAAFYVAGAIPSTDDCRPAAGDRDPTGTEHYVTYNEGRSGDGIEQTELGWVNPGNWANRGCKSQNGANCLSQHGYAWPDIVRFYYGDDIEIVGAEGPCVGPAPPPPPPPDAAPPPPPPPPPDAAIVPPTPDPDAAVAPPDAGPVPPTPEADVGVQPTPRFDATTASAPDAQTPDASADQTPDPVTALPDGPRRHAGFDGSAGCAVAGVGAATTRNAWPAWMLVLSVLFVARMRPWNRAFPRVPPPA